MMKIFNTRAMLVLVCLAILNPVDAQIKDLAKKATKKVLAEVKPLSIDFEVTKVKYDPLKSPDALRITMLFTGENPNAVGIKLNRIEFDIYSNDKLAAKLHNDEKIEIPKNGEFSFTEKAKIKIKTVGKTVFKAMRDDNVTYKIVGTYFVDTKLGTFSFKADLVEKESDPPD